MHYEDECDNSIINSITVPIPAALVDDCSCDIFIADDTQIDDVNFSYQSITVAENVTLTLSNSTLSFVEGGEIYMEKGANLIVDNSTLTACEDRWRGVDFIGFDGNIDLINGSLIEKAITGVRLGTVPWDEPQVITETLTHPVIIMDNSKIENCQTGIGFGYGHSESHIRNNSKIENCYRGIFYGNHRGLIIDDTQFINNEEGIWSADGFMEVRGGNNFNGGEVGICVQGTLPLTSGIIVGGMETDVNVFTGGLMAGIESDGNEHPAGAIVINCLFKNLEERATIFYGANQFTHANNTIEGGSIGVLSHGTGGNLNRTRCNELSEFNFIGIGFAQNNSKTQFLENHFHQTNAINIAVNQGSINEDIGTEDNPAANCFSHYGSDIHTWTNSNAPFTYHYFGEEYNGACQEPVTEGNYQKLESSIEGDYCQGDIGTFNLIDPGGTGSTGYDPHIERYNTFATHINQAEVLAKIQASIVSVIAAGGDDPSTYSTESNEPKALDLSVQENILDQWIRYGIYRGLVLKEYAFVEEILFPLQQWKWQTRLYGLKVVQGKYPEARQILQSLPANHQEEIYFNGVQQINLKRLEAGSKDANITDEDINYLLTVANSEHPSAGYARSLYRMLTGIKLPYDLSAFSLHDPIEGRKLATNRNNINDAVQIFPNPAQVELNVLIQDSYFNTVQIYQVNGSKLLEKQFEGNKILLNLDAFEAGIYLVKVISQQGENYAQFLVIE